MRAIFLALVAAAVVSACSSRPSEPTVTVSALSPSEAVPFLVDNPAFDCNEDFSRCQTSGDVAVKWGAGFCEDTQSKLETELAKGSVELFVDGRKIGESMITQNDERYERPSKGYCHTWLIKLAHWVPGRKATLRSAITYANGGKDGEETEVTIKTH